MDRFVNTATQSLFHFVITPNRHLVANPELYQPMKAMLDKAGNVKYHDKYGYAMSVPIEYDDRLTTCVKKWQTPANILKEIPYIPRTIINKFKEFINSTDIALFHHATQKESLFCNYRKPDHMHMVVQTEAKNSRDIPTFRSMERFLKSHDVDVYTKKVLQNPEKTYGYLINDPEKLFLGTNNPNIMKELEACQGMNLDPPQQDDLSAEDYGSGNMPEATRPAQPTINPRKRLFSTADSTSNLDERLRDYAPSDTKYSRRDESAERRPKALQNLEVIKECLQNHPHCGQFSDLVAAVRGTEIYDTVCSIYLDQRAEKIWNLAREELYKPEEQIDLFQHLQNMADNIKNTLTPQQTLALYNAWCEEQGINGKALAWFMISRLQNRAYQRIGVYLQGANNSGKTFWSTTLFAPLEALVGKMTTGGRFCLQDCERKRIIIGEEIAIGLDNIDRLKELMSGDITTCERKGKSVVRCKASLVLLNSINLPAFNVQHERQALMNRLFLVRNLKPSKVLPLALDNMEKFKPHPKFLTLINPPTDDELSMLNYNKLPTTYEPAMTTDNMYLRFENSWDEWLLDLQHGPLQLEPIAVEPLDKNIHLDWFLEQSPEGPYIAPLHLHKPTSPHYQSPQLVYHDAQMVPNYEGNAPKPDSTTASTFILHQNQLSDPDIIGHQDDQRSDNARDAYIVSAEDINRYILFNDQPISTTLSIWSKYAPQQDAKDDVHMHADDFGYTADLQFLHKDCTADTGTIIQYFATIQEKKIHMMTIKVPNIQKQEQLISKIHMDVSDHIKIIDFKGQVYVRIYQGLDAIPCLPNNMTKTINQDEQNNLAKIFIMLANIPEPTKPYYKLFMLNDLLRPQNIALWPIFELMERQEVHIMSELANAKLKDWLVRHRNGDSQDPDDETQDIGDADDEVDANANNNNDQALTPPKLSCFPPVKTLTLPRKIIKGMKILILMTDLMFNLLDLSFSSTSS
ncbi:hypothetical protein PoB_004494200 [Plakobranchus ocellatus]|uniref:NrS-1 polymerase-like helicase domain-containing protein n=1 Tax=Plakobranchus ocellatus TaxID=259542 RepID=A0AAV4BHJ8_9GAST|nr:hypothetical protein PoB_004494200 [Plakobranchus ocellatus]